MPGGSYDFANQRKFYIQKRASAKIKSMQKDAEHFGFWMTVLKSCETVFAALAGIFGRGKTLTIYVVDTSPFQNNSQ